MTIQKALSNSQGFYLEKPLGKLVLSGEKTLIIKGKNFKNTLDRPYYLVEGDAAIGVIKINKIYPIDCDRFAELSNRHKITEELRKRWWPDKEMLFAYEFELIDKFDTPKKIVRPKDETFLNNVYFEYCIHKTEILSDEYIKRLDKRSKELESMVF